MLLCYTHVTDKDVVSTKCKHKSLFLRRGSTMKTNEKAGTTSKLTKENDIVGTINLN